MNFTLESRYKVGSILVMKTISCFRFLFFFLLVLINNLELKADKIDSLKQVLIKQGNDTNKVNTLNNLSSELLQSSPDEARKYAEEALKLSEQIGYIKGKAFALRYLGHICVVRNDYINALEYYKKSLSFFNEINDKKRIMGLQNNIGQVNFYLGRYPEAIFNFQSALKLAEESGDKKEISLYLNSLGIVHKKQGNDDLAISYFERSLKIAEELGDKIAISSRLNNIGIIHKDKKRFDDAIECYERSLKISRELGDKRSEAKTLSNIGVVYQEKGNYVKAIEYLLKSYWLSEELGDKLSSAIALNNLASVYNKQKNYRIALEYAQKSFNISDKIGALEQKAEAASILAYSYANLGKYKEAYEYRTLNLELNDSLLSEENKRLLHEAEAKYQNEKKQKEIELLNKDKQVRELELKKKEQEVARQQFMIYVFVFGFVIISFFALSLYRLNRRIKNANKLLAEQKEEILQKNIELQQQKEEIQSQAEQLERANIELEKLSIVASETDNGVIIADENGYIEYVNNGFVNLYGYTLEEFKKVHGDNIYKTSTNPDIKNLVQKSVQNKESLVYTSQYVTKSGNKIWTQTTLTPILYDDGRLRKIVMIESDITTIKNAEEEIRRQKEEIEIKNRHITDSIRYAKRIQQAILPTQSVIDEILPDSFILYLPKDIVSGDFYWVSKQEEKILFSAVDCTGHGVPGAFMSIVGNNILNQAIKQEKLTKPSEILNYLSKQVNIALRKTDEDISVKDGMDLALCCIDKINNKLEFAGVHNPMILIRNNQIIEFKPDNHPIGEPFTESFKSYSNKEFEVQKDDVIYVYSDGYIDQFGGPKRKKFMSKRFKELLLQIHQLPMKEQKSILYKTFEEWKGNIEQYDDVLVMGVKI